MKQILLIIITAVSSFTFGQTVQSKPDVYDLPIPKDINECFALLNKTMPDSEIYLIKTLQEDSIYFNSNFKYGTDFFHAWKLYEGSDLTKYFNQLGLNGTHEMYNTILVSYHRYLNKDSIRLNEQIKNYQAVQDEDYKIYLAKLTKDTLSGIYIPKDLKDCFLQLDKILSTKDKQEIKNLKNGDETIKFHHSLGMWIRNNWGLWGGSRLQKYLLDKGLKEPDEMSALILKFYYDWLNQNNKEWIKWTE